MRHQRDTPVVAALCPILIFVENLDGVFPLLRDVSPARLVRRNPGVLRPGFVGMRGQWSYDYGMQDYEYFIG